MVRSGPVGCTVRRSIPRLAASTRAFGTALTLVLTIIGAAATGASTTGAGVATSTAATVDHHHQNQRPLPLFQSA